MEAARIRDAARLARDCVVMTQAVALGRWISTAGPRPVTPRRVLRKPDLPTAAAVIGVPMPPGPAQPGSFDLAAVNGKLAAPDSR